MDAFTVISEPSRRLLLGALLGGEAPVNTLVEISGMSQPVVSKHLRVLREAGVVAVRPDGQRRLYRLEGAPLEELDAWLEPYRRFWASKLDALEQHLAQHHAEKDGTESQGQDQTHERSN